MALLLRKRGIKRVRPLSGGLTAWKERNYPVDPPILVQIEVS
ncbi:MAG: hypothetical protein ABIP12_05015 [Terriglobales bacterium]